MEESKEFFRVEYIEQNNCVEPVVWFGNQGFNLRCCSADGLVTAQEKAEWFVLMFKKALNSFMDSQLEKVSKTSVVEAMGINNYHSHKRREAFIEGGEKFRELMLENKLDEK